MVVATSFRNPALLAKMADTVDEISGGRLILGLGAGWHEPEYRAFGYPFDYRVSRFEEALTIIHTPVKISLRLLRTWAGEDHAIAGSFWGVIVTVIPSFSRRDTRRLVTDSRCSSSK